MKICLKVFCCVILTLDIIEVGEKIMEISFLLFKQIAQFFIMIIMGYTLVKLKIVKSEDSKVLSMVLSLLNNALCNYKFVFN